MFFSCHRTSIDQIRSVTTCGIFMAWFPNGNQISFFVLILQFPKHNASFDSMVIVHIFNPEKNRTMLLTRTSLVEHSKFPYTQEKLLMLFTPKRASVEWRYGHQTTVNVPKTVKPNFATPWIGFFRLRHLPKRWLKKAGA